jgi:hypothetical protein
VWTAIRAINEGRVLRFLTKPCEIAELTLAIREGLAQKGLTNGAANDAVGLAATECGHGDA